jgi:putative DNA primase/helicase
MTSSPRSGKPGSDGRHRSAAATGGGVDLGTLLHQEVYPRLNVGDVFKHKDHDFHGNASKVRGGCPWHESESGTSFNVSLPSLLWYCGGCDVGGTPVDYLHKLQHGVRSRPRGADFVAVARRLFELAGVPFPERELTEEEKERGRRADVRRSILQVVNAHCRDLLATDSPAAAAARAYLDRRGFTDADVAELELGLYGDLRGLQARLGRAGFDCADVAGSFALDTEMVGYVVFPWYDDGGRPLTLYGKWPGKTPPGKRPKTTALPNPKDATGKEWERTKRSPLYMDRALRAGHKRLVLVEGVTDAALPQVRGDTRVVACVAGLLSEQQLETLARRRVESVVICLDPDTAGDANILRNVRHLLHAGIDAFVAPRLPNGQDPDEFVLAHGLDAWREHVGRCEHGYRFAARDIIKRLTGADAGGGA